MYRPLSCHVTLPTPILAVHSQLPLPSHPLVQPSSSTSAVCYHQSSQLLLSITVCVIWLQAGGESPASAPVTGQVAPSRGQLDMATVAASELAAIDTLAAPLVQVSVPQLLPPAALDG